MPYPNFFQIASGSTSISALNLGSPRSILVKNTSATEVLTMTNGLSQTGTVSPNTSETLSDTRGITDVSFSSAGTYELHVFF